MQRWFTEFTQWHIKHTQRSMSLLSRIATLKNSRLLFNNSLTSINIIVGNFSNTKEISKLVLEINIKLKLNIQNWSLSKRCSLIPINTDIKIRIKLTFSSTLLTPFKKISSSNWILLSYLFRSRIFWNIINISSRIQQNITRFITSKEWEKLSLKNIWYIWSKSRTLKNIWSNRIRYS